MASLTLKLRLVALRLTGQFPKTEAIEAKNQAIQKEFDEFKKYSNSDELKKYQELKAWFETKEHERVKNELKSLTYKSSQESQIEKEYISLGKNKVLKKYFSQPEKSQENPEKELSDLLKRYNELKSKVESKEFQERKAYLLSTDKFEKTEQFQKLQEYTQLKQSEKIKWYFKTLKEDKFKEIKKWELSFSEDFESKKLDQQKWITRYFWGEALLNNSYSLASDNHWYTDGANLDISNSTLKITTRKEKASGLSWDSKFGFVPKDFDFTSGIISTGHVFRQKHGKFEAKVKITCIPGVYHAFWLVGDRMLPEIDIFRKKGDGSSSLQGAFFWENGEKGKALKSISSVGGLSLDSEFYILGVEWNEEKITWTINGIPYMVQTNNLPKGAVYIVFSSGINGKTDESRLPAKFEIDWVKCWTEVDSK